ncbi:MAG: sulfatase-like hydrolase/transferase [Chitinophagaceae bacterium]
MRKTVKIFFLAFCTLFVVRNLCAQRAKTKQPNIIFILTDDMGYSDLGIYGNPVIRTPFLDSLARAGLMATNYVVSSPSCTPSRASLLTGRYASRYNLPDPIGPGSPLGLPDAEITLPEILKKAGYRTAMIGKWHLGDKHEWNYPTAQGFDTYYGMLYSHDYRYPYVKTDTTIKIFRNRTPEIWKPEDSLLTRLYTREAMSLIGQQTGDKPFFLYLAYNMPHLPVAFAAQASYLKNKQQGGPLGAVVEDLDSNIALIVGKLKAEKLLDNTIIAFSSDNGPWIEYPTRMEGDGMTKRWHAGSAGIFRGSKGQSYEGGVREPFILYWKDHIRAGTILASPISNLDIVPTLAYWANAKIPAGDTLDGENIHALLTGKTAAQQYVHRPIYIVNHGKPEAVRLGDWKYLKIPAGMNPSSGKPQDAVEALFNLNEDPSERVNLVDALPEKAAEMKSLFTDYPDPKNNKD